MAAVDLAHLEKAYGATPIVRGVSLHIASGELIALLGPSGCGKTTTLRMVAGLEQPDAGTITIGGELVDGPGTRVPPERRRLGMVFQSYAVWPHRSVEENVAYPLERQGVSRAERAARVREALDWVRLGSLGQRMPSQLSGGQLQRVAIARALVASPRVLLLDEPLSNLDAALREELRGEIAALRARLGTTMIFVTHDQAEALALADRVAVMNRGVIEQIDAPERIYREPATPYVAGFVGGANRLEGRVEGRRFVSGALTLELPAGLDAADGPATLAVRPEELRVGGAEGTELPLLARLFLGSATEYRFQAGELVLRAVGPAVEGLAPGQPARVAVARARIFPSKG
jgi:ABC-type Fe3+/spermidine/putrescine transport system ATPase subunit